MAMGEYVLWPSASVDGHIFCQKTCLDVVAINLCFSHLILWVLKRLTNLVLDFHPQNLHDLFYSGEGRVSLSCLYLLDSGDADLCHFCKIEL